MDDSIRRQIASLDPARDHQRIVHLSYVYDFPWDTTKALEFALFRTFAVPSIGALLDATGEFERHARKRYDDTSILIGEFCHHGYDSERGRQAIRTMNHIHGRFRIAPEDYRYVLSTFICEPPRWMARFGWRPYSPQEMEANFQFWREIGRRMHITEIPETYAGVEAFNRDFERRHFRFNEASARVARATRALFVNRVLPAGLTALGDLAVNALLDQPLLDAFGFARPPAAITATVERALRARAQLMRWSPRPHIAPVVQEQKWPTYPHGYAIDELGPEDNPSLDPKWKR
jgi:hypothetical protein